MKSVGYFVGGGGLPGDFFEERLAFDFYDSTHIVPVEGVEDLILLASALVLQLDFLAKVVGLGGVALLDDDLDDVLALEYLVGDHWHVHDADLSHPTTTYSRLKKSTAGTILSAKVLINSRNSSLCLRLISCPTTYPSLSSIPM